MTKELKQSGSVQIDSFSVRKDVVTLKLKFDPEEIVNSVKLLQGLNTDMSVLMKEVGASKAYNAGIFTIDRSSINRDGCTVVTLKSLLDAINYENIGMFLTKSRIMVMFKAVIELSDE